MCRGKTETCQVRMKRERQNKPVYSCTTAFARDIEWLPHEMNGLNYRSLLQKRRIKETLFCLHRHCIVAKTPRDTLFTETGQ